MDQQWALIVAGGEPIPASVLDDLGTPAYIVAADSGLDRAVALGISPDLVVGDLDSADQSLLERAIASGVTVDRHPVDKDASDLELALESVADRGIDRAILIGGTGGRLSHFIANALLLGRPRRLDLEWRTGGARVRALQSGDRQVFPVAYGELVSLLPLLDPTQARSTGLRWDLGDRPLELGSTRGISNEIIATTATVTVMSGRLLSIHERNLDET